MALMFSILGCGSPSWPFDCLAVPRALADRLKKHHRSLTTKEMFAGSLK